MENSSNQSIVENIWIELGIFNLTGISLSVGLSILTLVVVFMSRSQLKSIEIYNLILLYLFIIISQLSAIYCTFSRMENQNVYLNCDYSIFNFISTKFDILSNLTLFYYSLLQISTLSRSKFVLMLFKLVNPIKSLVIYELIMFSATFSTAFLFIDFYKSNCTDLTLSELGMNITYVVIVFPRLLIIFGYASATAYVILARLKSRKLKAFSNDLNELKRFNRNLSLMLKFLMLSIIFMISYIPIILPNLITITIFVNSLPLKIVYYSAQMISCSQAGVLLCVHNILKSTFLSCLSKIFKASAFKS